MSQATGIEFSLTAEEVVMMGRYPHFVFNPGKRMKKFAGGERKNELQVPGKEIT